MNDLESVLNHLLPLEGYTEASELETDVHTVMDAENPVELDEHEAGRRREPTLLRMDVSDASEEELERAVQEWEQVRDSLSTMYRERSAYFEWEYRRAFVLELLAEIAERQFGEAAADRTARHRITVEVQMWTSFAKHLLLEVKLEDVTSADDDYGFLDVETKHQINSATMTTASIFESVGEEILTRQHDVNRQTRLTMADIVRELQSYGYLAQDEQRLVNDFRKNIRNEFAHDILKRNFDDFDNFRREVVRPCWSVLDLCERLAEKEIAPDR